MVPSPQAALTAAKGRIVHALKTRDGLYAAGILLLLFTFGTTLVWVWFGRKKFDVAKKDKALKQNANRVLKFERNINSSESCQEACEAGVTRVLKPAMVYAFVLILISIALIVAGAFIDPLKRVGAASLAAFAAGRKQYYGYSKAQTANGMEMRTFQVDK